MGLLWRRRRDLHPDQVRAIDGLPADGRYLLLGPPGSGKTSILLHRGHYLRLAPHSFHSVRLVTFTRTLREFIAVDGDERFPPGLIQTVKEFMHEIYDAYNQPHPTFPEDTPFKEQNRLRAAGALELLASGQRRVDFDALLIDEVQDLSTEEISVFAKLSTRLMIAGDSRQKLFGVHGGIEAAHRLPCEPIELKHHFRISRDICRVADSILLPGDYRLVEYCHYQGPPPSLPSARAGLSRAQQVDELLDALDLQLDTYNDPGDLIGVIVHKKNDCDYVQEQLDETRFGDISRVFHSDVPDRRFEPGCRICIMPVQSCKGLEFRALHWLFVDDDPFLDSRDSRERAYTVVTRAKSSLTAYHNRPLPGYLAAAFPAAARALFEDDHG